MVSGMHEAVFTMVKAGWPREIEQPLYFAPDSPFYRIPILLWACRHCCLDIIKFLVNERNASVDVFDDHQYCLFSVCDTLIYYTDIDDSKRVEILRFLIDEAGADITTRLHGESLLDKAGFYGRLGVVKYIHEEKKDVLKLEESNVANHAAYFFCYDLLVYLIEKRRVPVRTLMGVFYEGVRQSKREERKYGLSSVRLQIAARRNNVKAYLKGLIRAEYNSDEEEIDSSDSEEEVVSEEEEDIV